MTSLISRLWHSARKALSGLRASLMPLDVLTRSERAKLSRWLWAFEVYVRRVVLLEALQLKQTERKPLAMTVLKLRGGIALVGAPPAPAARAKPKPRLRLWPRPKPGPRARLLGRPTLVAEIWAERARAALIARLAAARAKPRSWRTRAADRLDALDAVLDAPLRYARRLARKLKHAPRIAFAIAMKAARRLPEIDRELQRELEYAVFYPAYALLDSS